MNTFTCREDAVKWAKDLLKPDHQPYVLLDLESTGVDGDAGIVQVGILSAPTPSVPDGRVLLDVLLNPCMPIPPRATALHGITDADVTCAPTFDEVWPIVRQIITGHVVVAYNAEYDHSVLAGCLRRHNASAALPLDTTCPAMDRNAWQCAMLAYSAWVGEPGKYGGFKWQRLDGGHGAISDCRAAMARIRMMAGAEWSEANE